MLDDWLNEGIEAYKEEVGETTSFGYDATKDTGTRRSPKKTLASEDKKLKKGDRKILQSTTRDARRNVVMARWAIKKHIDFVCDHSFQANTGDEAFDQVLNEFVRYASNKENFDISGRYNLDKYARLAESSRIVDGDFMSIRVRGGYLQQIEGDRIRNPETSYDTLVNPDDGILDDWVHGVKVNRYGKHTAYSIHRRDDTSFVHERNVSASKVITLGFYDRFDQTRGISPLAAAINAIRDLHESYDHALAKAKVGQLFALAITRDADWALEDSMDEAPSEDRSFNFDKPQILDLDAGEDAKFLSNNTPESDTQAFWQNMTSMVLKALNIPYSFYEENYTNFFGSRSALILYLRSVEEWRQDQVEFRNDWLCWRLKVGQLKGEIQLPDWFECDPKNWHWIAKGVEYWNPMQEVNADIAAVEAGLRTRSEIRRERYGDDWNVVVKKLSEEKALMEELNVLPIDMMQPPELEPQEDNNE